MVAATWPKSIREESCPGADETLNHQGTFWQNGSTLYGTLTETSFETTLSIPEPATAVTT